MALQLIFGMSMKNLKVYLTYGRRIFIEVLRYNKYAEINLPSEEQIDEYATAVQQRHHDLGKVWTTMDGLKYYLQQFKNTRNQERDYNGWTRPLCYISYLFLS